VHRRLIADDSRGVGEPLNETQTVGSYASKFGGVKFGPGLVIRGTHTISLEPATTAARVWRPLIDRVFSEVQPSFTTSSVSAPLISPLAKSLPPNVQIITMQSLAKNQFFLRLAHQFGIGEDSSFSQPVTVDLASLFNPSVIAIKSATEVSLTNNQNKTAVMARRAQSEMWHQNGEQPHSWRKLAPLDYQVCALCKYVLLLLTGV
jgi:hypothetical protein